MKNYDRKIKYKALYLKALEEAGVHGHPCSVSSLPARPSPRCAAHRKGPRLFLEGTIELIHVYSSCLLLSE